MRTIEMAEAIAVEVANKIMDKMGTATFKAIMFVNDLDSHIERLGDIESIIAAALRKTDPFETRNDAQGRKIKRLRRIHEKLLTFFDDPATRKVTGITNFTAKVRLALPSIAVARKVDALKTELRSIARDFSLADSIVTENHQNRCASSVEDTGPFPDTDELIGRDTDKENIINMLCNSSDDRFSPSVVSIVGLGGLGKTALAQHVYNDDRVKASFDKLLWVWSDPNSGVREIVEKIVLSATGENPCNYGKEQLQRSLLNVINGKKCLIVLDNVWYRDNLSSGWLDWSTLLGKEGFEASGSKILITTRIKRAAKIMGTPYMLGDLAENDSWTLLRHFALGQEHEKESRVEEVGKEIVKMCPKLPLVIKVVGLRLAEMDTTEQWENFKKKLASNSTLYMHDKKIVPTLKLCYDQLHDANLQRCVVFCSLFPKGHVYSTNYMIQLWMASGFLEPEDGISLEDVGEGCVLKLASLGFLELDYSFKSFMMHDVLHDLTLFIGKSTHRVINSETKEIAEGVRHVSLKKNSNWRVLLEFKGKQNLQSIVSVADNENHYSIPVLLSSSFEKLVSSCPNLRVLEANRQGIEKVPNSISQMGNLGYLNLSGNPLKKLPNSITRLVNLLSLDVSFCPNLQELPRDINRLNKLKKLKIRGRIIWPEHKQRGSLSHMPKGIGKLSNLEELDFFVVVGEEKSILDKSKASGGATLEELGCLNNLQRDLWIIVQGESKHLVSKSMRTKPLEKKTKLIGLVVEFKNSTEEDEMFLEELRPSGKSLRYIHIVNYGGKKLPSWMRDDRFHANFPELVHIEFFHDDKYQDWGYFPFPMNESTVKIRMSNVEGHDGMLEWVPEHSRLKEQSRFGPIQIELTSVKGNVLKDFILYSLKIQKDIAQSLLLGVNLERSFLNIQKLELSEILELEAIPDQFQHLSSLKWLRISRWPNLKAIPDWIGSFTALRELRVDDCPRFESLPHQIGNLTSLRELYIGSCPKLESLPNQIGGLTSLRELYIERCPKLESLPHQIGNLAESCSIVIPYCSQVLVDKCRKPGGEYWPLIQHLCEINITFSKDIHVRQGEWKTWREKNSKKTTTPPIAPPSNAPPAHLTSNDSPLHSNTTSFKPYLFFILAVIMLILAYVVGLCLV